MAAADGAGRSRRRDSKYSDLTLVGILKERPARLLSVPDEPSEFRKLLGRLGRNTATQPVVRKLLSNSAQVLLDECSVDGRSSEILLTLLTQAQRAALLPDRSWWLLTVVASSADSDSEDVELGVGWVRLRLPNVAGGVMGELIQEWDFYPLPAGADAIRDELILIALESSWKPKVEGRDRVSVVLGPAAADYLGGDIKELEARAAVDGVHMTVVLVPRNSSDRPWIEARNSVLELEGPVLSAVDPGEQSGQRVLEAIRQQGKRQITALASPVNQGWTVATMIEMLQNAGILTASQQLRLEPKTEVRATSKLRVEVKEIYLAKSGSGPRFDVLVETGHRCHHKSQSRIQHRSAPKKYKGILRYLRKLEPPGQIIEAKLCTHSGCGLVWVRFEAPVYDPADGAGNTEAGASGSPVRLGRGPPTDIDPTLSLPVSVHTRATSISYPL